MIASSTYGNNRFVETRDDDSQCHIDRQVVYVVKKFTAINRQAQVCACTVLQAQVCSVNLQSRRNPLQVVHLVLFAICRVVTRDKMGCGPKGAKKSARDSIFST